jgi:hypothetical protein
MGRGASSISPLEHTRIGGFCSSDVVSNLLVRLEKRMDVIR